MSPILADGLADFTFGRSSCANKKKADIARFGAFLSFFCPFFLLGFFTFFGAGFLAFLGFLTFFGAGFFAFFATGFLAFFADAGFFAFGFFAGVFFAAPFFATAFLGVAFLATLGYLLYWCFLCLCRRLFGSTLFYYLFGRGLGNLLGGGLRH